MSTRRGLVRHARKLGLVALSGAGLALGSLVIPITDAQAVTAPCQCAFDFEDGTTQGWTSSPGLSISNQTSLAYSGRGSLVVAMAQAGAISMGAPSALAGVTNGTAITYHLYAPVGGAVTAQPFAKDRTDAGFNAAPVTLDAGWNTLTWTVPYEFGVGGIGVSLSPLGAWSGNVALDAVAWPDSFVRRAGTQLTLSGKAYRFDGINIYNANSTGSCWYAMAEGDSLDRSLKNLPGLSTFRAWFFQSLATRDGQRDWSAFDHTLATAAARGVKVIVTLGDQWPDCDPSGYKELGWYQGGYRLPRGGELVGYRDWVKQVVTRYRNDPTIAMWQLINEAAARDSATGACQEAAAASALRSFADDVGGLAHSLDPNHLVDLGSLGNGQCGMTWTDYELVHGSAGTDLCEYHDYGDPTSAMPGDQWNGLKTRLTQCGHLGKPLFIGETGIDVAREAPTLPQRALDLKSKLSAQFGAGVVGVLMWNWNANCGLSCTGYDIGLGDPSVALLKSF